MAFNQVTNLDFDDIKKSLKEYLRSSEVFTDYNLDIIKEETDDFIPSTIILQHK